jgi:hypothetical protein
MEVNGQLHAPAALPPGKKVTFPFGQETEWATQPNDDDCGANLPPRHFVHHKSYMT